MKRYRTDTDMGDEDDDREPSRNAVFYRSWRDGPFSRTVTSESTGTEEFAILWKGETPAVCWDRCKKYPDHNGFTAASDFTVSHLPSDCRDDKLHSCIKLMSDLTVRLKIRGPGSSSTIAGSSHEYKNAPRVTRMCTGYFSYFDISSWASTFEYSIIWKQRSTLDFADTADSERFSDSRDEFDLDRIKEKIVSEQDSEEMKEFVRHFYCERLKHLCLLVWPAVERCYDRPRDFLTVLTFYIKLCYENRPDEFDVTALSPQDVIDHLAISSAMFRDDGVSCSDPVSTFDEATIYISDDTTPRMPGDPTTNISGESPTNISDDPTTNISDEATINMSDEATINMSDDAPMNMSDDATTNITDEATTNTSDDTTPRIPGHPTTNISDDTTTNISDDAPINMSDDATTNISDDTTPRIPGHPTTNISDDTTTNISVDPTTDISDEATINISDDATINMPDDATTNISDEATINISEDPTINISDEATFNITGDTAANISDDATTNISGDATTSISGDSTTNITGDAAANITEDTTSNICDYTISNISGDQLANISSDATRKISNVTASKLSDNTTSNISDGRTASTSVDSTTSNVHNSSNSSLYVKAHLTREYPCPCPECKNIPHPQPLGYIFNVLTDRRAVRDNQEAANTVVDVEFGGELKHLYGQTVHRVSDFCDLQCLRCVTHELELARRIKDTSVEFGNIYRRVCTKVSKPLAVICAYPHGHGKMVSVGEWTARFSHDCGQTPPLTYVSYRYTTPTCPGSMGAPVLILGKNKKYRHVFSEVQSHYGTHSVNGNKSGIGVAFTV